MVYEAKLTLTSGNPTAFHKAVEFHSPYSSLDFVSKDANGRPVYAGYVVTCTGSSYPVGPFRYYETEGMFVIPSMRSRSLGIEVLNFSNILTSPEERAELRKSLETVVNHGKLDLSSISSQSSTPIDSDEISRIIRTQGINPAILLFSLFGKKNVSKRAVNPAQVILKTLTDHNSILFAWVNGRFALSLDTKGIPVSANDFISGEQIANSVSSSKTASVPLSVKGLLDASFAQMAILDSRSEMVGGMSKQSEKELAFKDHIVSDHRFSSIDLTDNKGLSSKQVVLQAVQDHLEGDSENLGTLHSTEAGGSDLAKHVASHPVPIFVKQDFDIISYTDFMFKLVLAKARSFR